MSRCTCCGSKYECGCTNEIDFEAHIKSLETKLALAVELLTEAVETNVDSDKVWQEKARKTLAEIKGEFVKTNSYVN